MTTGPWVCALVATQCTQVGVSHANPNMGEMKFGTVGVRCAHPNLPSRDGGRARGVVAVDHSRAVRLGQANSSKNDHYNRQ